MGLRSGVEGTPSDWTRLLEGNFKACRRVVVRIARAKGPFTHASTVFVEPLLESMPGDMRLKVTVEDGSSLIEDDLPATPRMVAEHCWAAACAAGVTEAERHDLKVMRGEFEGYDGDGEPLWAHDETRKRLNLDNPGNPYAQDEDPDADPQEKKRLGELAWERRDHRKTRAELRASLERERDLTKSGSEMLMTVAEAVKRVNHMEIDFAKYVGQRIRDDIEESRADARIDYVTEEVTKQVAPKLGLVMEGLAALARTYGQKKDPLEVPEPPAEFEAWMLQTYADSYTDYSAEKVALRMLQPGGEEYRQAWFDHLILLNNSVEGFAFTADLARKIKLWAGSACQTLGLDPHLFSRLAFCEGDPDLDQHAKADDGEKGPQPGGSPQTVKEAE